MSDLQFFIILLYIAAGLPDRPSFWQAIPGLLGTASLAYWVFTN